MMGQHEAQKDLFRYHINLDQRVPRDHPLRQIAEKINFEFVRAEVEKFYGAKGNVSIDPVVILKLMFLLFYDHVPSERELMKQLGFRLDYLWFLGYGLDDEIPNHSVLSKARKRWGKEVFEGFFVRTVMQCVEAGLVEGQKIHVDSSLIDANASKDSVKKACPELIAAVKQAYQAQESKLEDTSTPEDYQAVNDRLVSTTDPDAAMTRKGVSSPLSSSPRGGGCSGSDQRGHHDSGQPCGEQETIGRGRTACQEHAQGSQNRSGGPQVWDERELRGRTAGWLDHSPG